MAIGLAYIFVKLIQLWLLAFLGLVLALLLSSLVNFFERRLKLSRPMGFVLTVALIFAAATLFIIALVPIIVEQGRMVLFQLPVITGKFENFINSILLQLGSTSLPESGYIITNIFSQADNLLSQSISIVSAGISGILAIIMLIVIVLCLAMRPLDDPKSILRWFPASVRPRTEFIWRRIVQKLRAWLVGQLFSMTIIALFYATGLSIIGVPYAIFFGILAGLLCFVPYIGPPLSTLGPLLFALGESPFKALCVIVLYIASQTIESYFLTPMVMRRQVKLHPIATILSIMAMGELFGIVGITVAVPVVASLQFLAEEIYLKELDEDEASVR